LPDRQETVKEDAVGAESGQKVGAGEAAELLRNARQQMDRDMQAIREKTAQSDALAIALDRCTADAMPSFSMVGG